MATAVEVIRKKARDAHAKQQLLIAEQHYRTLLKQDPNVDDAINLGALLRSQGRLQEGSLLYKSWINKFKGDARLAINACNCWNDNNEAELSNKFLKSFITEYKAEKQLLICYADSLSRLNRIQECISILHQCIGNDQQDKEIWVRIGLSHAKMRSLNDALKAFEKANQIDPTDLEIISNRITVLKDLGDFDNAELLITGLSPEKQLHVDIAQATAGLFMAQNKLVEATYLLSASAKRDHIKETGLIRCCARGLRWTVAPYRILQRALCYEPQNEDVQEALIQILAEMGKNEESQRCLKIWHKTRAD